VECRELGRSRRPVRALQVKLDPYVGQVPANLKMES
jgi:hypothetical protein